MNKKLSRIIFVLISAVFVFASGAYLAEASSEIHGYAWSSNIGWISFNCKTGGVDREDICSQSNYKVEINNETGNLFGYAWSSGIGWINFNPLSGYPTTPNHSAKIENDRIIGWARVVSATEASPEESGGFTGWILFLESGDGVVLSDGDFSGYAWGGGGDTEESVVIGWIDFSHVSTDYTEMYTPDVNFKINNGVVDYCHGKYKDNPPLRMEWEYFGEDSGYQQSAYRIRILGTSYDSGKKLFSGSRSYLAESSEINYGESYTAELKVWNENDEESEWIQSVTEKGVPDHHYPIVDFTWDPEDITSEESVWFFDETITAVGVSERGWTFEDGSPNTSSLEEVEVEFNTTGNKNINLRIRDESGFECDLDEDFRVKYPLPDWREISPFGKAYSFLANAFNFFKKLIS